MKKKSFKKKEILRFIKFGIVGTIGAGVTYFFWIFLEKLLGIPDRIALAIAIEISIVSNFFLNNIWTFKDRKKDKRNFLKFLKFNLVSFWGLLINVFIYTIFRDYLSFSEKYFIFDNFFSFSYKYFAEFFGILGGFLWNFFINNFWTWRKTSDDFFKMKYKDKFHKLEENYWWFLGRRDIIFEIVRKDPTNSKILDIGCAGGLLLSRFKKEGFSNCQGIDIDNKAINLCKDRGLDKVSISDAIKTNFKDENFDIIIASDVLEHIFNDKKAIREWRRILKNGGSLIIFVPAHQFLWSNHDIINKHYRRYSKKQIIKLIEDTGFYIKKVSYWNFLGIFPAFLEKIIEKIFCQKKKRDRLYPLNKFLNNILYTYIKIENRIALKGINIPLGLSIFCIAVKK